MRVLLVLVGSLLLLAPAVHAQDNTTANSTNTTTSPPVNATTAPPAGPIEFTLEGHGDNGDFYWTLAGATEHNPTLKVEPGQQVTFHVSAKTSIHNFKIDQPGASASKPINEGDSIDVQWTAPTDPATVTYICTIHGPAMSGKIQVGSASNGGTGGGAGAGDIQGDTIDLGDYGFPDCKGTKIPAIVTRHVTGGPTLADYGSRCKTTVAGARPASGADYVIPASFALVALGIVGVVWAHRAYKP